MWYAVNVTLLFLGEDGGWVSAASAHYVDVEAADWTLPDEAFPLRAPPAPPAPPPAPSQHTRPNEQEHDAGRSSHLDTSSVQVPLLRLTHYEVLTHAIL